jgi:hypothetical protein
MRRLGQRACAAAAVLLLALVGCKSKDGGSGGVGRTSDPLVRIPAQNVPIPGRNDAIGTKGTKGDPLLERPVGRDGKTGVGYTDDPERFKGTFIPGTGSTPASLATKMKDGDATLKIDTPDNRVPLRPAGGVIPDVGPSGGDPIAPGGGVGGGGGAGGAVGGGDGVEGLEPLYAELAKYGEQPGYRSLVREEGKWHFRTVVMLADKRRSYDGVGATPAEAVKNLIDMVVLDRK